METKTLKELLDEAAVISRKVQEIPSLLIEKVEKILIPVFVKVLIEYGIEIEYFEMRYCPFYGLEDSGKDDEGNSIYSFAIDHNGSIWKCQKDSKYHKYNAYEQMRVRFSEGDNDLSTVEFIPDNILYFIKEIKNDLECINKEYYSTIKEMDNLLKEIQAMD